MTPETKLRKMQQHLTIDVYTCLKAVSLPCWYVRTKSEGIIVSGTYSSPGAAWRSTARRLLKSIVLQRALSATANLSQQPAQRKRSA